MLRDRLPPTGVGVDRLGIGAQLQGREPQDLPVDKTAIAKLTGVSRTALYSFMITRGLRPSR